MREKDSTYSWTAARDGTLEERVYYVQNWRSDVVALLDAVGNPLEEIRYSAYGTPSVHPIADVNHDGLVNSTDQTVWGDLFNEIPSTGVYAHNNLNRDELFPGDLDDDSFFSARYTATSGGAYGINNLSSLGNRKGYAGYEWDVSATVWHVRHRVLDSASGKWTRMDPLGYVDGAGLNAYAGSQAILGRDPTGLWRDPGIDIGPNDPYVKDPGPPPDCTTNIATAMADPRVAAALAEAAAACPGVVLPNIVMTVCGGQDEGGFVCTTFGRDRIEICRNPNRQLSCPHPSQIIPILIHELEHFAQSCRYHNSPQGGITRCGSWNRRSCATKLWEEREAYCKEPQNVGICQRARDGDCDAAVHACRLACLSAYSVACMDYYHFSRLNCINQCIALYGNNCPTLRTLPTRMIGGFTTHASLAAM